MKKSSSTHDSLRRGLFWFRHDLRLHDMPSLLNINDAVDELLLVYIHDCELTQQTPWECSRLGPHRKAFLNACISELDCAVQRLGQRLIVLEGKPAQTISELVTRYSITDIGCHFYPGFNERKQWEAVIAAHPHLIQHMNAGSTLYTSSTLPFALEDMPIQFTAFRKMVEKHVSVRLPKASPVNLAKPVTKYLPAPKRTSARKGLFNGGERAAIDHINDYLFETMHVKHYKETRNAMDDWYASSKLSSWLASGSLSPRWVYSRLKEFETAVLANESTYWLFFELLWREYFSWEQIRHGARWFQQKGLKEHARPATYNAELLERWRSGRTGYDIVDACMRQLSATGYMSNRGRQLAASCLVHEYHQNWQYGAAWFEYCLIDYDVGSNWGNWLYLSGVGHDPRGHRKFDLAQQAEYYDPNGEFRSRWLKGH